MEIEGSGKITIVERIIKTKLVDSYLQMKDFWLKEGDLVYNERTDSEHFVNYSESNIIRVTNQDVIIVGDHLKHIATIP